MLFIVAADHTARAMVGLDDDPLAMADRRSMLDRLLTALANPRVDGVLASAEIIDDLVVARRAARQGRGRDDEPRRAGRCQRGSSTTASPPTTPTHLVAANLDAGKVLLRIDYHDRRHGADAGGRARGPCRLERPPDDGDGRADPVHQGRQR